MCGICGIVGDQRVELDILKRMTHSMVHRGPDDEGYFIEGGVGLGMRRLSIIDLAGGKQPITDENGNIVIVFNGEIYNYPELRRQLIDRGHVFRTNSDTECIVHLYEEYAIEFPRKLRGMFAIALYDCLRKRFILARDHLGKKPLYYAVSKGCLIFGSEIKPILVATPDLRRVNARAIQPFFRFGFVPEPETAFEGISVLPAGCTLEWTDGTLAFHKFWDLNFIPGRTSCNVHPTPQEIADELEARLMDAVRVRLMSDVPLGAFLSGGPDSSLIVAMMSRLMNRPVKTFTIAFDEKAFDESSDAQRIADSYDSDHHILPLRLGEIKSEFFDTLDEIVRHTDQPFGDSSALPTYYVSKLAREHVTVILAGDGADEVFGGYTIFQGLRFAQYYQRIPRVLRERIIPPIMNQWAESQGTGAARWRANAWHKRIADSNLPLVEMLVSKYSITPRSLLDTLVRNTDAFDTDILDGTHWITFGDAHDPFEKTLYAGIRFLLVNDMLVKVDRMSMAHSLEVRNPYLDRHLIEFAATVPSHLKLRGWETKAILRDVAARYLPSQNVHKIKHGFGVPISLWLSEALMPGVRERIESSTAIAIYLQSASVKLILEQHIAGVADYGQLIWCLLVFDAWYRMYIDCA